MATFVIAELTFLEAARRKILWMAFVVSVIFLIVYALGFNEIQKDLMRQNTTIILRSEIDNFLTIAGLYVVNFLGIMMTVLTSVDTLSGEVASGTIHTLLAKPVRRWEIVMGKWLGFAIMITLYLILTGVGTLVVAYTVSGYAPPNVFKGLSLIWLNCLLLLAVSFFGGSIFSTITNGVMVFGLYGVAFVGGWVEQLGSILKNQSAVEIGVMTSLIMPSEALWKRAAFEMQSPLATALGGITPFSATSVPSPIMIGYAVVYLTIALIMTIRMFSRRDL